MDLKLRENGNGGDLTWLGRDFSRTDSFENMLYLALFGGNVEQSTPNRRAVNEQAFDWWGNSLLIPNNPEVQLNSLTERALHKVALNSAGRVLIEQAVKRDLDFMKAFAEVEVSVSIISDDRVRIDILIQEPDKNQDKRFVFLWDAAKGELFGTDGPVEDLRDYNTDYSDDYN